MDTVPRIKVDPKPPAASPGQGADTDRTVVIPESDPAQASALGSLSSQYSIVEKIGEGGMGVVYLAKDRKLGRYVAIKRLNRASLAHASFKERFMREARAIAALNHIHIVHIYALGEDEDGPYIVMEYLAGPQEASPDKTPPAPFTLADRVNRNGPLPVNDAVDLVLKVCKAVDFAHACSIIHRDLKPSNVLLDESSEPKIVDFGLARLMNQQEDPLTVPGEKMLSLGYGAPEQELDATTTDERADIYGLGAILYFSITGKNPRYFRENDVPEALRMPIVKALETDRVKRWANVKEFTSALMMIKAPSTIVLPTVKTTWRCKWCDTVNPVAIQFCGRCGWDGGDICPECGSETRVGIQFCGNCGADAREYEQALALLKRLQTYREEKQFELIPPHAERVSGFDPVGPGGQKIVTQIRTYNQEAREAIHRRSKLRETIQAELAAQNYERVRDAIHEYDTLATDRAFAGNLESLPDLTQRRNLERAHKAVEAREWDYAERTCQWILDNVNAENLEARQLISLIRAQRKKTRWRRAVAMVLAGFLLYFLLPAPVYRMLGRPESGWFYGIFDFSLLAQEATFLRIPMEKYAAVFDATAMFSPRHLGVAGAVPDSTETSRDAQLNTLRAVYEATLARTELEYARHMEKWPQDYAAGLNDLKQKLQREGDFEGWSAVKAESDRFAPTRKIPPEALVASPQELRSLQAKFQAALTQGTMDRSSRILLAAQDYVNKLTPMQKELTMRGKMGEAQRINNEIKRVSSSPEVTAAEIEIEKHESERAAP